MDSTILLIIAGLVGLFAFERSKRQSAEALLENQETKEKILDKDKEIANNNANLNVEASKQDELKKNIEEGKKDENSSPEDLANFFNRNK